jgi:hypothetical protein
MRIVALVAVILLSVGCRKGPPDSHQPPGDADAGGPEQPEPSPEAPEPDDDGEAEDGDDGELPGPTLPDGPRCDSDADCSEGLLCEGVGCGPNEGRCVGKDRMCTRDLAQYCGCDGQTFQSSGSCPGARYAYLGPCEPKLEDGEACTDGRQCVSGSCVGEGLEGCSRAAQGVCGQAACTKDLATYCGCNNIEFQASGSCPNRQFAYRGPCEG